MNLPYPDILEDVETYLARLEKSGRILIPAPVRRRLGLTEGSQVVVRVEDSGKLSLVSRSQARAEALTTARERIRKFIPPGSDLAEESIRERRAEVERQDANR